MSETQTDTEPVPYISEPTAHEILHFLTERGYRCYPCHMRDLNRHLFQRQPRRWPNVSLNIWQYDPGYFHHRAYQHPVFEVELASEIENLGVSLVTRFYTLSFAELCRHIDSIEVVADRLVQALRLPTADTEAPDVQP
ncbi:MAG: hypothetical protein V4671_08360 [Armatimonadota bacterium]